MDSEYITRLHLVKTPWFAVCLHWIHKPDPEPHLHDHPVSFLSVVLCGGYDEVRRRQSQYRAHMHRVRRFNVVHASYYDRHTIVTVKPHTLTLCFMGPKVREWGFHTTTGWVYWKDYYAAQRADRAGKVEVAGQA